RAISRSTFAYSIDELASLLGKRGPTCPLPPANASTISWAATTYLIGRSNLSNVWDGSTSRPQKQVFGDKGICGTDVGKCTQFLNDNLCNEGFAREQSAFWAQQSGSVRQRFITLEVFDGRTPASDKLRRIIDIDPAVKRLRSAVAFDHDQWGQILTLNSIGEANSDWRTDDAPETSVNAEIRYASRQGLNARGGS